jgi:hypothetical protein
MYTNYFEIDRSQFTLKELIRIDTTPKTYTIIANNKVYCTNDLNRTLTTFVVKDFPDIKQSEILIIKK